MCSNIRIRMLVQQGVLGSLTKPLPPMLLKIWHRACLPLINPKTMKGSEGEAGEEDGGVVGVAAAVEDDENGPCGFNSYQLFSVWDFVMAQCRLCHLSF